MHGKRKLPFCVLMRRFRFSVEFNRMTHVGSSMLNLEVWNYSRRKKPTVFLTPCKKGVGFTGTTNSSCFLFSPARIPDASQHLSSSHLGSQSTVDLLAQDLEWGVYYSESWWFVFLLGNVCPSVEMCVWLQPALKKMLRLLGKVKKQHKDCCPVTLDKTMREAHKLSS